MEEKNVTQAKAYIEANKDRYSLEALRGQLRAAGYPAEVVEAAGERRQASFFAVTHKKVYASRGAKVVDFLVGFVGAYVLGFAVNIATSILFGSALSSLRLFPYFYSGVGEWILLLLMYVGIIAYLWKRRRYMAWGVLAAVGVSLLLVVLLIGFLIIMFRGF